LKYYDEKRQISDCLFLKDSSFTGNRNKSPYRGKNETSFIEGIAIFLTEPDEIQKILAGKMEKIFTPEYQLRAIKLF